MLAGCLLPPVGLDLRLSFHSLVRDLLKFGPQGRGGRRGVKSYHLCVRVRDG